MASGTSTQAPRMGTSSTAAGLVMHAVDEHGVWTRLPIGGAVNPMSRRSSRPVSPTTHLGAGLGLTEVVYEAASILLSMENLNNGEPSFNPRPSMAPAADEASRRGRSQRRHGELPAT